MFYQLPPVGNRVSLDNNASANSAPATIPSPSQASTFFYQSGTAALASAIITAMRHAETKRQGGVAEVLLPAYACPDLISAVCYAGARPVLVDLRKDRPWLDSGQLEAKITSRSVAIIAVDLFGIAEDWAAIEELCHQHRLLLIEDSAQYFPGHDDEADWRGDLVVLSFGRGKPLSLLGGGAVIASADLQISPEAPEVTNESRFSRLRFTIKARLYNAMISPHLYWLPQSLPFLHLGETRYHTLQDIEAMAASQRKLLALNLAAYQSDRLASQRCENISSMLDSLGGDIINLPRECGVPPQRRLLRYPILLDAQHRDPVYAAMRRAGLGASVLYPTSLPGISGLENMFDPDERYPVAEAFSTRLLTLPVHAGVRQKDIDKMAAILERLAC